MESGARKTLLIVDDDSRIRSLLTEALGAVGYATLEAADGQEALDVIRSETVDCIIADIKMPEIDGLALLSQVKSERPALPVVMITGFGYRQQREQATSAGADGFLMKPFRLSKIEEVLARVLKPRSDGKRHRPIRDVLIVEDDNEFRVLLTEIVEALGYNTEGVADAESALERVAKKKPDVIISDFKLPGMSGEELIREVKAEYADLPIVLITGYAPSLDGKEFADGAADAFLLKPFRIDRIGDILRSLEETTTPTDQTSA
ncbi:MAG TPA: response regulator [Acidobacteriota bacterium]|nr:response regulator [Acidobacteriota bacterium]